MAQLQKNTENITDTDTDTETDTDTKKCKTKIYLKSKLDIA